MSPALAARDEAYGEANLLWWGELLGEHSIDQVPLAKCIAQNTAKALKARKFAYSLEVYRIICLGVGQLATIIITEQQRGNRAWRCPRWNVA